MIKTVKFIYKARKSNETMKYTKDKEYHGEFATEGYSNILLIENDLGDRVLVYKFDFEYTRKEIEINKGEINNHENL